jgi:hypothetical protein
MQTKYQKIKYQKEEKNNQAKKENEKKQKEAERKKAADERKTEKKRLMALSEKELMVELILEMKSVHTICNRIERKCYEIEDNQKKA